MEIARTVILIILLFSVVGFGYSQTVIDFSEESTQVKSFIFNETVSVNLDRLMYLSGDSIYLSCYTYDYILQSKLSISSVLYVEILTNENIIVEKYKLIIKEGIGNGVIKIPKNVPTGVYYIRAYTNYMRNFPVAYYFINSFTIINPVINPINTASLAKDNGSVDVKLYYEGSNLIYNVPNKVCLLFDKKPSIAIPCRLYDSQDSVISEFFTNEIGLANVTFTPQVNKQYKIVYYYNNSLLEKKINIQDSGIALRLARSERGSVFFELKQYKFTDYPLMLVANYKNAHIELRKINDGDDLIEIEQSSLPNGIVNFSLVNSNSVAVSNLVYYNEGVIKGKALINTDKEVYKTRSKVSLTINFSDELLNSAYSISVYNIDSLFYNSEIQNHNKRVLKSELYGLLANINISMDELLTDSNLYKGVLQALKFPENNNNIKQYPDLAFLAERNGDIITGKVDSSLQGNVIHRSFLNSTAQVQNKPVVGGDFYFKIDSVEHADNLFFSSPDISNEKCSVTEEFSSDFCTIIKEHPNLIQDYYKVMNQQFVNLQINEAYKKEVTNNTKNVPIPFYIEADKTFVLEEYPAFKTVENFIFDVIPWVEVVTKGGVKNIRISQKGTDQIIGENPMFLLDGVPNFDSDFVRSLPCEKISSIAVIYDKYFFQNACYDGMLDIRSKKGDGSINSFKNTLHAKYIAPKEIEFLPIVPEDQKPYFKSQLYWRGLKNISGKEVKDSFYLPDYNSLFLIKVTVVSPNGKINYFYKTIDME